ncbi:MAG: ABC transporter permease subunit [Phycisphaeraceae bacterium]
MQTVARWLWYLMPANPIVLRIVQGGSRRLRHLWIRMGYLGALILLVLIGLMSGDSMGASTTLTDLAKGGTRVFTIVAYGQVILVCLLAPLFMAGAINSEHQGETFDILLTTPLSNLQIVLGTLLSRLYFILALLLSGLPLFAVLLIFGGVPVSSVFVAFAVAILTALFVGSIAVTLSVLRTGGRKAVFVFVIVIAGYLVAVYAADQMFRLSQTSTTSASGVAQTTLLTPLHPLLVLEASLNNANYRPPSPEDVADRWAPIALYLSDPLWAFSFMTFFSSIFMLLFSATQVRRLGQGNPLIPLPATLRRWLRLEPPGERSRRARNVWQNPIAWREANARGNRVGGILARWGFLLLGVGAAVVLLVMYHNGKLPRGGAFTGSADQGPAFRMGLMTLLLLELAVIVIVAIYMAAGSVSKEREDGTLDLLLTTPITPKYYVWGKLRGLVAFLSTLIAVPVLTMGIACVYFMFVGPDKGTVTYSVITHNRPGSMRAAVLLPEMMLLLPMVLVPFVALCATVGMMWSVRAKSVIGAVIPSVAIIGAILVLMSFCGMNAAANIPVIGPILNAFSPVTTMAMFVNPWQTVAGFADAPDGSRATLFMAALIAGGGYALAVYIYLTASVKNFDQTVRRLSGTKA